MFDHRTSKGVQIHFSLPKRTNRGDSDLGG